MLSLPADFCIVEEKVALGTASRVPTGFWLNNSLGLSNRAVSIHLHSQLKLFPLLTSLAVPGDKQEDLVVAEVPSCLLALEGSTPAGGSSEGHCHSNVFMCAAEGGPAPAA